MIIILFYSQRTRLSFFELSVSIQQTDICQTVRTIKYFIKLWNFSNLSTNNDKYILNEEHMPGKQIQSTLLFSSFCMISYPNDYYKYVDQDCYSAIVNINLLFCIQLTRMGNHPPKNAD